MSASNIKAVKGNTKNQRINERTKKIFIINNIAFITIESLNIDGQTLNIFILRVHGRVAALGKI